MKIPLEQAKEFNKVSFPVVKTSAGCLIIKDNKVLLTKRSPEMFEGNKWCIPGGHIDIGETAEEAIRREVKEETNLEIKDLKFLSYFDEYVPRIKKHSLVLIFQGEPIGEVKVDHESTEFAWFTKKEAANLELAFINNEIINKFFNPK